MGKNLQILIVTSEWPSPERPNAVPFIVRQIDFLKRAGIKVDIFHFRGGKNPINYIWAWYRVRKHLSRKQYDLIHAHWGQSGLLAFPKSLPLVVTYRGSDLEGIVGPGGGYTIMGKILTFLSKWVANMADEIIVVSDNLANQLQKNNIHIIPSGLDLELFSPIPKIEARKILGWSETDTIVFFGGNPAIKGKRFSLAKEAIKLLEENFLNIRNVAAQDIEHIMMPVYMSGSDVLLLVSSHEGSPNVVKEALACNLPVVSTDVGDVKERIGSINGCVVCEDDKPETIAKALNHTLSLKEPFKSRYTVLKLDERLLTQKVIQIYQDAIAKTGS